MQQHLLTTLILLPFVGALAVIIYSLFPARKEENYKWIAFIFTVVTFALSLLLIRETRPGRDLHLKKMSPGLARSGPGITWALTALVSGWCY